MSVIEVLAASSSRSSDSCRLCRRANRFKLPFGFGRQEKVALSQTLNLVRPDLDLALPPGQVQIRMMALGLRDSPNLVRKGQRCANLEGVSRPNALPLFSDLADSSITPRAKAFNGVTRLIATFLVRHFPGISPKTPTGYILPWNTSGR